MSEIVTLPPDIREEVAANVRRELYATTYSSEARRISDLLMSDLFTLRDELDRTYTALTEIDSFGEPALSEKSLDLLRNKIECTRMLAEVVSTVIGFPKTQDVLDE
jgi:hypothetical protein